jgi:hypothetical protein
MRKVPLPRPRNVRDAVASADRKCLDQARHARAAGLREAESASRSRRDLPLTRKPRLPNDVDHGRATRKTAHRLWGSQKLIEAGH